MHKPSFISFVVVLLLVAFVGAPISARALDDPPPQDVVESMSVKLVRGVANVATGWVEFPKQIITTFQEDGVVKGIFVGPLKGVGMTLVRTLSGAGEIAFFMVPAPGNYDPYFEPEYVWQGDEKTGF